MIKATVGGSTRDARAIHFSINNATVAIYFPSGNCLEVMEGHSTKLPSVLAALRKHRREQGQKETSVLVKYW